MPYKLNPFTGDLDYYEAATANPMEGEAGEFTAADLDGDGNLTKAHSFGTTNINVTIIDNIGRNVLCSFQATVTNVLIELFSPGIPGTWKYTISAKT